MLGILRQFRNLTKGGRGAAEGFLLGPLGDNTPDQVRANIELMDLFLRDYANASRGGPFLLNLDKPVSEVIDRAALEDIIHSGDFIDLRGSLKEYEELHIERALQGKPEPDTETGTLHIVGQLIPELFGGRLPDKMPDMTTGEFLEGLSKIQNRMLEGRRAEWGRWDKKDPMGEFIRGVSGRSRGDDLKTTRDVPITTLFRIPTNPAHSPSPMPFDEIDVFTYEPSLAQERMVRALMGEGGGKLRGAYSHLDLDAEEGLGKGILYHATAESTPLLSAGIDRLLEKLRLKGISISKEDLMRGYVGADIHSDEARKFASKILEDDDAAKTLSHVQELMARSPFTQMFPSAMYPAQWSRGIYFSTSPEEYPLAYLRFDEESPTLLPYKANRRYLSPEEIASRGVLPIKSDPHFMAAEDIKELARQQDKEFRNVMGLTEDSPQGTVIPAVFRTEGEDAFDLEKVREKFLSGTLDPNSVSEKQKLYNAALGDRNVRGNVTDRQDHIWYEIRAKSEEPMTILTSRSSPRNASHPRSIETQKEYYGEDYADDVTPVGYLRTGILNYGDSRMLDNNKRVPINQSYNDIHSGVLWNKNPFFRETQGVSGSKKLVSSFRDSEGVSIDNLADTIDESTGEGFVPVGDLIERWDTSNILMRELVEEYNTGFRYAGEVLQKATEPYDGSLEEISDHLKSLRSNGANLDKSVFDGWVIDGKWKHGDPKTYSNNRNRLSAKDRGTLLEEAKRVMLSSYMENIYKKTRHAGEGNDVFTRLIGDGTFTDSPWEEATEIVDTLRKDFTKRRFLADPENRDILRTHDNEIDLIFRVLDRKGAELMDYNPNHIDEVLWEPIVVDKNAELLKNSSHFSDDVDVELPSKAISNFRRIEIFDVVNERGTYTEELANTIRELLGRDPNYKKFSELKPLALRRIRDLLNGNLITKEEAAVHLKMINKIMDEGQVPLPEKQILDLGYDAVYAPTRYAADPSDAVDFETRGEVSIINPKIIKHALAPFEKETAPSDMNLIKGLLPLVGVPAASSLLQEEN